MRKIIEKLFGEELTISQKLLNVIMLSTLILGLPCIPLTFSYDSQWFSSFLVVLTVLFGAIGLVIANMFHKFTAAAVFITISMVYFLFPVMYFCNGGRYSGMPIWLLVSALFIWLIFDGILCYIFAAINCVITVVLYVMEYNHPELYVYIENPRDEIVDILTATFIATGVIGLCFKYQKKMATRQREKIEKREAELRQALEKLEKADAAKTLFLSNMSHEIRTPINTILGMNEMILRECREESAIRYASSIESAGEALMAIVNDILDISNIESGCLDVQNVEYSTGKLLADCYKLIAPKASDKKLDYMVKSNPFLPTTLLGDEARIRRILYNLLSNAVKYTTVGSILLSVDFTHVDVENIKLRIVVKDTGVGIKSEDTAKIFDDFERSALIENRNIEGTGLGLSITKRLLDAMGGTISVNSEYGKGSSFTVEIVQKCIDASPLGNFGETLHIRGVNDTPGDSVFVAPDAKILSVDDVKMNHDVMMALLKNSKVQLDCVYSGREALNMLSATRYDLVLMDIMMPEMDGVETLEKIRLMGGDFAKLPVIAVTANAVVGAKEKYLSAGFSAYISKPVNGEELEKTIMKFLPKHLIGEKKTDLTQTVNTPQETTAQAPLETVNESGGKNKKISKETFAKLGFLDMDYALECCANSLDLYVQAMKGYCGQDSRIEALKGQFKDKDWENYRVNIHAVKSSSLLLGARDLSEKAKALEFAIKEDRIEYVENNHEEVMKQYAEVLEIFSGVLDEYGLRD